AEPRIHVGEHLAYAAPLAAATADVEDPQTFHRLALSAAEHRADQLIAGANGEDHRAAGDRRVQPPAGPRPLGGEPLPTILAAAEEVDVALARHRLVGVHLDRLDVQPAQPGPAGEHDQVAPVAVRAEQVRVDPHQPQGARPGRAALAGG